VDFEQQFELFADASSAAGKRRFVAVVGGRRSDRGNQSGEGEGEREGKATADHAAPTVRRLKN
jgi:hypothetical protein